MFGRGMKHCSIRRSNKFIRRKIHASQSCLKKLSCQGIANKNSDIVKAGLMIPRDCISYIAGSVSAIASLASCYLVFRMAKYSLCMNRRRIQFAKVCLSTFCHIEVSSKMFLRFILKYSIQNIPPCNSRSPWKFMVGRRSFLGFGQFSGGQLAASFSECCYRSL